MCRRSDKGRTRVTRLTIPFTVYGAVTVVVPLLGRADRSEAFWEHAVITLLVPAMLILVWAAGVALWDWQRKRG